MENPKVEGVYSSNELVGYFHSTIYFSLQLFFFGTLTIDNDHDHICRLKDLRDINRYFVIYEFLMIRFSNGYNHCSNI